MKDANQETETKSQFARRVGVAPSRITALLRRGLPVTDSGYIPVNDALAWIEGNVEPQPGSMSSRVQEIPESEQDETLDLDALSDYQRGIFDCAYFMVRHLPASAALLVARSGASLEVAYTLYQAFALAVIEHAYRAMGDAGAPRFEPGDDPAVWPEQIDAVDWEQLAAEKGGTVDYDAWRRHAQAHFGAAGP